MIPKLFPLLLLFNLLPMYLNAKNIFGALFKKRSTEDLKFDGTPPTIEQFKKLVGEIANVLRKEGKCGNINLPNNLNLFILSNGEIKLNLEWILEKNCFEYENYSNISNSLESMFGNKKNKPTKGKNKWQRSLKYLSEVMFKYNCCGIDIEKAIEIADESKFYINKIHC